MMVNVSLVGEGVTNYCGKVNPQYIPNPKDRRPPQENREVLVGILRGYYAQEPPARLAG
jgi:hypothetical protein